MNVKTSKGRYKEYRVKGGRIIRLGLDSSDEISIAKTYYMKNMEMPSHDHVGKEVMGVISGKIVITGFGDGEKILKKYDVIIIPKGLVHSVKALADSWIWNIVMPGDIDFPNGVD